MTNRMTLSIKVAFIGMVVRHKERIFTITNIDVERREVRVKNSNDSDIGWHKAKLFWYTDKYINGERL